MITQMILILMCSTFILSSHPLTMIINLILSTLTISMMIIHFINTPWFSYIISLILIGAMLVIFIYLASLAPNELFKFKINYHFLIPINLLIMFILLTNNPETLTYKNNFMLTKQLFSTMPFLLNLTLASFLFITMIAIAKITTIYKGPIKSN